MEQVLEMMKSMQKRDFGSGSRKIEKGPGQKVPDPEKIGRAPAPILVPSLASGSQEPPGTPNSEKCGGLR